LATTETVIGQTKDGRIIVYFENAGPASYSAGGFDVSIGTLRTVEKVLSIGNTGGYLTDIGKVSISGNTLTIPVYYHYFQCPVTCPAGARECNATSDLSGTTFSGIVVGF